MTTADKIARLTGKRARKADNQARKLVDAVILLAYREKWVQSVGEYDIYRLYPASEILEIAARPEIQAMRPIDRPRAIKHVMDTE